MKRYETRVFLSGALFAIFSMAFAKSALAGQIIAVAYLLPMAVVAWYVMYIVRKGEC